MNNKELLVVLQLARTLISDKEHWTKTHYARDGLGNACHILDGTSWCLEGALLFAAFDAYLIMNISGSRLVAVLEKSISSSLVNFNDNHTHQDVLNLLDRTIHEVTQEV